MGPHIMDTWEGGNQYKDVGEILHQSCSGDTVIQAGELGGDPQHFMEPGGVTTLGGKSNHG